MRTFPDREILTKNRQEILRGTAIMCVLASLWLGYIAASRPVRVEAGEFWTTLRTTGRNARAVLRDAGVQARSEDMVHSDLRAGVGSLIALRRAQPVLVRDGTEQAWIMTARSIPENILAEAGRELYPGDRVWVDGIPLDHYQPGETAPTRIRVEPGHPAVVQNLSGAQNLRAAIIDPAQSLLEAGVTIHEADEVRLLALTGEEGSEEVTFGFESGVPVEIHADGKVIHTRVRAGSVAQALAEAGAPLLGLDRSIPDASAAVPRSGRISVTRVREEVVTELEPVPFETNYQPLPDLEIDSQRILDTGSYGVRASQLRIRYENGEEVARSVEGEWLAREPEPRIVGYGTDIVVRTLSTENGTIEYWRAVQMWATSYSPSRAGTPLDAPNFGITASGAPLKKGLVAIDRTLIPFGTRMYVPGYGFAEAADTGSGIRGRWIDLGYEDHNWVGWAQYVTVYFLTPVPDPSSIIWIFP